MTAMAEDPHEIPFDEDPTVEIGNAVTEAKRLLALHELEELRAATEMTLVEDSFEALDCGLGLVTRLT